MMTKLRIAFLGLGIMGSGMARRLLGAGFPLTVYNRTLEKTNPFSAAGAAVGDSPREVAANADVIIAMVADDPASRTLWLDPEEGALGAAGPGTIIIESSTLTVGWVRELAAAVEARGCEFIDAPVTGSKSHAAAGELNFLVGGHAVTLEKVRPVLAAMGRSVTHLGPAGSGALVKLINNFVCGVEIAALAEALAMIERSGLDRAKALAVLADGAPGSPLFKAVAARMTAPDYTPNFMLRLMAKDLAYAAKEGDGLSVPIATGAAALEVFERALKAGLGEKDIAAVVEQFRQR